MSCNCKQNKKPTTPKTIIIDNTTEIIGDITYTKEQLDRVINYFNSPNKTTEEMDYSYKFVRHYLGENIQGYCGQACIARINKKLQEALNKLEIYEQTIRKTKKNSK